VSTQAIIEAQGVTKIYRSRLLEVRALDDVDISVDKGEMVSVMGPSGSGKTTLLNCLSGLDSVDTGEITVAGNVIAEMSDDDLSEYRARMMGFIFQSYNLLPVLTAQENVELPLVLTGVKQSIAAKKALEKLELVGLADRADHTPSELSGGQQQRVTIARALANDPALVWADEPTGNLDSTNEDEIMELLRRLNVEQSQTFVIVTLGVFVVVGPAVASVCFGAMLVSDRFDAVGRHHPDTAEVRSIDQPVQPAFELQPVDDEDLRFADGPRIGRGRLVDMRIPVGADERRDGDVLSADTLHYVAENREGGDHRDRSLRLRDGRSSERQGEDSGGRYQKGSANEHRNSFQASR